MEVYADVIFITNFIFDLGILVTLLKMYSKKIRLMRLLLSACIGGVQGIFVFIPYFRMFCTPPMRFFLPFVMTMIVLCPCEISEIIKGGVLFLSISFLLSGIMSFCNMGAFWGMALPFPLYLAVSLFKRNASVQKKDVILFYKGQKYCGRGFYDSGNMMFYKDTPVILANLYIFKKMFGNDFTINALNEWIDAEDIRIIPYSSLGGKGAVIGIRLDKAVVGGKKFDNVILGYSADKFSENIILNGIMT